MFSHHITNKRLIEQTTHKLCIIKVHKGVKLQNNNININPIKSLNSQNLAKYIISTTFRPIEVFIVAGGIYLFMTFVIHNVIKFLEKKYSFN